MDIITIIGVVTAALSLLLTLAIMFCKFLAKSKNKKIAQSATNTLEVLYAVRDAMFSVEDKKYESIDKEAVALSLAKETCRKQNINVSDEELKNAKDFVMEIGNTINKRDSYQSDKKISVVANQNITSNNQN